MINAIPSDLQISIKTSLSQKIGRSITLRDFQFSSGGCINKTGRLETSEGSFFIKWNRKSLFPDMFEKEKRGLETLISANHALKIPNPILSGDSEEFVFLILENIKPGARNSKYWEKFGSDLATLHKNSNDKFGLDYDNYIGSLEQKNSKGDDWLSFFKENRIELMFKKAFDSGLLNSSDSLLFKNMFKYLDEICPKNIVASLIHGDLWSGNLMVDDKGNPCLIDPAVYYGFREMELAFTELFGRYNDKFYHAYKEAWPLDLGYEERKDLWNLYPLLVHVNLFGESYTSALRSILKRFK